MSIETRLKFLFLNMIMKNLSTARFLPLLQIAFLGLLMISVQAEEKAYQEVEFASLDGLKVTADVYASSNDPSKPFIILCHQARWSRGEYREIAPKLNKLGFNCMAIDQRSGDSVNDVEMWMLSKISSLRYSMLKRN